MQFTYEHYIGEEFYRFHANFNGIKPIALDNLKHSFHKLGGKEDIEKAWWYFPLHISSQVLEEVIHNTCFMCGGLMKDSTAMVDQEFEFEHDVYGTVTQQVPGYAKQLKVRKCSSCGHSHT